jgi:Zn-dependent protease
MLLLSLLTQNPIIALSFVLSIVAAVTIHEFAHAWSADRLGDDTPRLQGRVNLNPLSHLDPIGSLVFLLVGFGWGRPVMYNPMRLSHKIDELWIALAGPASNLILAFFAYGTITLMRTMGWDAGFDLSILRMLADINVLLAAFNMLPIPPLDGSAIIAYFFPEYRSMMGGQVGLVVLLLLIATGMLRTIVTPVISLFTYIATLLGRLG